MGLPRKSLVSLEATPYYHCVSRCVRHAFLCGRDKRTGRNFDHRRQWIEKRLLLLAEVFALDVCAYAVMSNHYHIVLHINTTQAKQWSLREVVERWHQLCKGSSLSQRFLRSETLSTSELKQLKEVAAIWRARLMDISWFMRMLNEYIARKANREDGCTGRFWEGRFKSQALLDEKALAACMTYVDLNPIRAKIADTLENSKYTSIRQRITAAKFGKQPKHLFPFSGNLKNSMPIGLPFRLKDYLELVDWSGRCLREDKRGAIDNRSPSILEKLQIDPRHWLYLTCNFESRFKSLVGAAFAVRATCKRLGKRWTHGISDCAQYFSPPTNF